jgi:L-threonylcarbamoyladenylate synthase
MSARILHVSPGTPEDAPIQQAADLLRAGRLVAFPTETVYGLGAHALDEGAVRKVFEAKGRPPTNPLIVHVAGVAEARPLAAAWPAAADRLAERFWPGPLTLIVPRMSHIPDMVTAGLGTVALRSPAHPVARALLAAAGIPVAAPSANRFTRISPTTAAHVAKDLGERIDLILDGGPTGVGIESTVLDLSGEVPVLLRPGAVSRQAIEAVIGPIALPDSGPPDADARPSPGMHRRHYAPAAQLLRIAPSAGAVERAVEGSGDAVGLILRSLDAPAGVRHAITLPADAEGYARGLYAALHEMEDRGCGLILVEEPPAGPEWSAVRDRLDRAAAPAEDGEVPQRGPSV